MAVPTVGMIVPNWFLIVPQLHTLNIAQQNDAARTDIFGIAKELFLSVASPDDNMLIFEHGAQEVGSAVGCGLDHAHLHIIIAPTALIAKSWSNIASELSADAATLPLEQACRDIDGNQPYYMAWHQNIRLLEQPAAQEISQRFRRIIAAAVGLPDKWDYRTHRFDSNIDETVAAFHRRGLAAA